MGGLFFIFRAWDEISILCRYPGKNANERF